MLVLVTAGTCWNAFGTMSMLGSHIKFSHLNINSLTEADNFRRVRSWASVYQKMSLESHYRYYEEYLHINKGACSWLKTHFQICVLDKSYVKKIFSFPYPVVSQTQACLRLITNICLGLSYGRLKWQISSWFYPLSKCRGDTVWIRYFIQKLKWSEKHIIMKSLSKTGKKLDMMHHICAIMDTISLV